MEADDLVKRVSHALLGMQRYPWEQGVAAQAFLELGETNLVVVMARDAVNRQIPDGRLAMVGSPVPSCDPAAVGEAVLFAAGITGDRRLNEAADRQLHWLLDTAPRTSDGTLYHNIDKGQVWVDAYYMAPPFLAVAGYGEEALRQVEGMRRLLWDPQAKLFHHIWDDDRQEFARAAFWGVGNGWAAAGMARIIAALPEGMAEARQRLIGYVREVLDGCLAHQRPDALFHDVVDDPATFVETNLAQMISYTIYRGVADGWLDAGYLDAANRMRIAVHGKVDAYGFVQGVCAAPHFDRPGFAPEGQAFFLLMEAAAARLTDVGR